MKYHNLRNPYVTSKTNLALGIIVGSAAAALLAIWLIPGPVRGVSSVHVDFAGCTNVDGKHYVTLIITNGSSCHIRKPEAEHCFVSCEYPNGATFSGARSITACGLLISGWGWWQLKRPDIPTIAPGEESRLAVPIHAESRSWQITIPLSTVPFRDRLPYALRSRWPARPDDTPVSFELTAASPPPPTASAAASTELN